MARLPLFIAASVASMVNSAAKKCALRRNELKSLDRQNENIDARARCSRRQPRRRVPRSTLSPRRAAASRLRRVQEDLLADYYRVHDHGFHWFLRQAYFHPDQQHHHGRKRGGGYGGCGGLSEFFCAAELNSTLQSTTRSGPAVVKLEPLIKQKNRKRPEPHSPHTPHRFLLCTYTCGLRTIRTGIPVARTACVASSKLLGTPSPANPSAAKTWSNSLREGRSVST